jgi:hypothetical protein
MTQGPELRKEFFFWTGPGSGGRGLKSNFLCISYKNKILLVFTKSNESDDWSAWKLATREGPRGVTKGDTYAYSLIYTLWSIYTQWSVKIRLPVTPVTASSFFIYLFHQILICSRDVELHTKFQPHKFFSMSDCNANDSPPFRFQKNSFRKTDKKKTRPNYIWIISNKRKGYFMKLKLQDPTKYFGLFYTSLIIFY